MAQDITRFFCFQECGAEAERVVRRVEQNAESSRSRRDILSEPEAVHFAGLESEPKASKYLPLSGVWNRAEVGAGTLLLCRRHLAPFPGAGAKAAAALESHSSVGAV